MDLQLFRCDLLACAAARAEIVGCGRREGFVEEVLERLRDAGEVPDWEPCAEAVSGQRNRRLEMDAFAFDEADDSVHLFLAAWDGGEEMPATLTLTDAREQGFRRLQAVWEHARSGWLEGVEESRPIWDLARRLKGRPRPSVLRLHVLSDRPLSERVREIPGERASDGTDESFQIWDITRLLRIHEAESVRDDLVVDLTGLPGGGLPVLPATSDSSDYEGYLAVIPAGFLAETYLHHGSRLLEGNVRTYLGSRGNVNRGIRLTLEKEPHRFFAYNNGIACTASSVEFRPGDNGKSLLLQITDLQIVNGAQTTASLAGAFRESRHVLENVYVPIKLTVVRPNVSVDVIPLISRYANSQNSVRKSDFFANHEFHRDLEQRSRRILAPAVGGSQVRTHWYYERARGQWLNEQTRMTPAERDRFRRMNPREQLVTKTDLAVVELSFGGRPDVACKGAEKSFEVFAGKIADAWENERERRAFGDEWFKGAMARVILFRTTERIVGQASWYSGGGERRPIVAHTVNRLGLLGKEHGTGGIDWTRVWSAQQAGEVLERQILATAEAVAAVVRQPAGDGQSVTEWAKTEACRTRTQAVQVALVKGFVARLCGSDDVKAARSRDRANVAVDEGLAAIQAVIAISKERWAALLQEAVHRRIVRPVDAKAAYPVVHGKIPNDKQARQLVDLLRRCREEGIDP